MSSQIISQEASGMNPAYLSLIVQVFAIAFLMAFCFIVGARAVLA
jgi:hypothetical protein